jgi:hypothetical protein
MARIQTFYLNPGFFVDDFNEALNQKAAKKSARCEAT